MKLSSPFAIALALLTCVACFGEEPPYPEGAAVEELQVARPLAAETDEALRAQIQTIQAVRENGDEAPSYEEPLATNRDELEQQCVTALKEIAFCTNDDAFLDLVGGHPALTQSEARDRFMERVHYWFEPGAVRVDCRELSTSADALSTTNRRMWQRAAMATDRVCADFGRELLDAGALERLAPLWAPR